LEHGRLERELSEGRKVGARCLQLQKEALFFVTYQSTIARALTLGWHVFQRLPELAE
jgi:hypothetical protein